MEKTQKVLVVLAVLILLLAAGNLAINLSRTLPTESKNQPPETISDNAGLVETSPAEIPTKDEAPENDNESAMDVSSYTGNGVSFQYPTSWHIFAESVFDDPNHTGPHFSIFVNPNPITVVTPGDGPMPFGKVTMHSTEPGSAIYAPYEGNNWAEFKEDEITINGEKGKRLRLTAKEFEYGAPYLEVLFIGGYEIIYSANKTTELSAPEWTLIKNSLKFN